MKLVTFERGGSAHLGVLLGDDKLLDLQRAEPSAGMFESLLSLIDAGETGIKALRQIEARATAGELKEAIYDSSAVKLMAPIPRPRKNVFCVGRNYIEHVNEGYRARGAEIKLPEYPQFFTKPPTAVIAHGAPIPRHAGLTDKLDYEIELALIIGRGGCNIPEDKALDHIFGYTILNDVTARDLQRRHDQWFKGKGTGRLLCPSWPSTSFCVMPFRMPSRWTSSCALNGRGPAEVQHAAHDLFDRAHHQRIVAGPDAGARRHYRDRHPSGVGYAMDPPNLLKSGDVVTCRIEGAGTLGKSRGLAHRRLHPR